MELSKKNHGVVKTTVDGTKFLESYGKDDSDVTGSARDERKMNIGGGINDLSRSLIGATANQKGGE
ncbi:hypothetical protein [Aestuariivirga sp.]|uniref:hypothetical protein n=1 Tax=Aestuariivirga sp. TaxID=2650926 RepID=UPI0039E5642F